MISAKCLRRIYFVVLIPVFSATPASAVEVTEVSRDEAHDREFLVRDMVADLREDFFSILRSYTELNQERAGLGKLSVNLAARKKWLEENDKRNRVGGER